MANVSRCRLQITGSNASYYIERLIRNIPKSSIRMAAKLRKQTVSQM